MYVHALNIIPFPAHRSSAEPTEDQPPEVVTPQQQVVIQPAQPQGDLLGGDLLDLLDISTGPTQPASTYNAPAAGGGGRRDLIK